MSSVRYDWWPYVKGMIRRYPLLKSRHDALHDTSITAQITGVPHASGVSNPTANAALRELTAINQREYDAVKKAIETTKLYSDGADRLKLVRLVLWDKSHTIAGAAMQVSCSWRTAAGWHGEFIRLVASYFGLID